MSSTEVQLPDTEQAVATLDSIYTERFFDKMAGYGFQPRTDEEAMAMLQTAAQLDSLPDKQAAAAPAGASPFVQANEKLAAHLQNNGVDTGLPDLRKQAVANERSELALALTSNADLYKSALVVNAAQQQAAAAETA